MVAAHSPPAVPLPNVTFDGNNFQEWSMMLRVCLDSQRLWGHLTGHTPRPAVLVHPAEPTTGADDALPTDEAQVDYTVASEQLMFDLSYYEDWAADEACAAQILLGSMEVEFAMDLSSLPSTRVM
jgi:hypothetical protein